MVAAPVDENRHSLKRLVTAIKASRGRLQLLVAVCDNWRYRDEVIATYEGELAERGVQCYRVKIDAKQPSLKRSLAELAQTHTEIGNSRAMVTVLGMDELLGLRLNQAKSAQEKLFFSLQWTRESLRSFSLPVVLWLKPSMAAAIAKAAPDFWSWRSGVFEFSQPMAWRPERELQAERSKQVAEETQPSQSGNPAEIEVEIAALKETDPSSPLLGSLYNSLGKAYKEIINYSAAEAAYKEALRLREAASDPVDIATSLNDLALLYESMGRYGEAEPLYKRSLGLFEAQLGADHPDTASSLNNLAGLYRSMGRYSEAEPLYTRSLEIREAQLGADHPDTASSLNNLAGLYESMGRYSEAEPLYLRCLPILKKRLGPDHPNTKAGQNNFRYFLQQVVEAGQSNQLSDHPFTQALLQQIQQPADTP